MWLRRSGRPYHPAWASFTEFLKDLGEAPDGTHLRRLDPTEGYLPGNVAWAAHKESDT